jgi:hypothetical protein
MPEPPLVLLAPHKRSPVIASSGIVLKLGQLILYASGELSQLDFDRPNPLLDDLIFQPKIC